MVAYAVLAYITDFAVGNGWLTTGQMLIGLGLAESTPGPLIMVTQYVGFVGAWNLPGDLAPLTAGILGALITTYVTFLPCFFFIFAGAPFIEAMAGNQRIQAALTGVTAAVVGVIPEPGGLVRHQGDPARCRGRQVCPDCSRGLAGAAAEISFPHPVPGAHRSGGRCCLENGCLTI